MQVITLPISAIKKVAKNCGINTKYFGKGASIILNRESAIITLKNAADLHNKILNQVKENANIMEDTFRVVSESTGIGWYDYGDAKEYDKGLENVEIEGQLEFVTKINFNDLQQWAKEAENTITSDPKELINLFFNKEDNAEMLFSLFNPTLLQIDSNDFEAIINKNNLVMTMEWSIIDYDRELVTVYIKVWYTEK